ncbi:MAG TPA: hypothetical protein VHH90_10705 [Polyangia bacterium]|nr:hypothetical protein [Polyangia bacterium]HVY36574.1 hypothetical protein [Polyangia bacterium]
MTKTKSKTAGKKRSSKPAPWEKPNPKAAGGHKKLSAAAKERARARAAKAGRRYPNLVDNMWAARTQRS